VRCWGSKALTCFVQGRFLVWAKLYSVAMNRNARILFGLLVFNGVSAVGGGIALMTGLIPKQASWIQHTDFASLYFPGVILMAIVGGSSLIASLSMMKATSGWELYSILAGVIMLFWIVGEIVSIRGFHPLQVLYFVTGALVIWCTPKGESGSA
jgi:hypothetical protein